MSCAIISRSMPGKVENSSVILWNLICHTQVLKDPENKRKVLERTPMRRIGEPHEVSGAPGRQAPAACRITRTVPHVAMAVA